MPWQTLATHSKIWIWFHYDVWSTQVLAIFLKLQVAWIPVGISRYLPTIFNNHWQSWSCAGARYFNKRTTLIPAQSLNNNSIQSLLEKGLALKCWSCSNRLFTLVLTLYNMTLFFKHANRKKCDEKSALTISLLMLCKSFPICQSASSLPFFTNTHVLNSTAQSLF